MRNTRMPLPRPIYPGVCFQTVNVPKSLRGLGENLRLVEIGCAATVEGLSRHLDIEERLDALIDKGVNKLLRSRARAQPILTTSAMADCADMAQPEIHRSAMGGQGLSSQRQD